jgi:hypothetical protein
VTISEINRVMNIAAINEAIGSFLKRHRIQAFVVHAYRWPCRWWQGQRPAIRRRLKWGTGIGLLLIVVVIALLSLADSFTSNAADRCAPNLLHSQWPGKWIGCAMSKHGDLAGALIGAAGILWAAWLAFQAVQEQIGEERERDVWTQRPWLFLEGATVRRRDLPGQPIEPNAWYIKLHWKNIGRSPAMIERCEFKLVDKDIIPAQPDYTGSHDLSTVAMAAQDTEFETNEVGPGNVTTKNGQPILFVMFGRLTYRELNELIHHTGFALEVSPHIAAFNPHYNRAYDYYD